MCFSIPQHKGQHQKRAMQQNNLIMIKFRPNPWTSGTDPASKFSKVFKCLNGLAPRMLEKRLNNQKDTRGNKSNLVVPRIRTETT